MAIDLTADDDATRRVDPRDLVEIDADGEMVIDLRDRPESGHATAPSLAVTTVTEGSIAVRTDSSTGHRRGVDHPERQVAPSPPQFGPRPPLLPSWATGARAAGVVFALFVAVAFPLLLLRLGSYHWFLVDDWDFLATRQINASDLFRPHNEHWSTLPILAYRAVFAAVGIRSYMPYQALIVATHLTTAVLLRAIMRRARVGPWIATLCAGTLVLFGTGQQNIIWSFQIGFVGGFGLGLAQLLLADHDSPICRRDGYALLAGAAALMCSGTGINMVIVVGVAVLIRRGWRAASVQVIPLLLLYGVWYAIERPRGPTNPYHSTATEIAAAWVHWCVEAVGAAFVALGFYPLVGLALAVVLIVGLYTAWRPMAPAELRRQAAAPAALIIGGIVFVAIGGSGRYYFGIESAHSSRYMYLIVAFLLPALAVAADAVIRRWHIATPVVIALLLVGVPGNIMAFDDNPFTETSFATQRNFLFAVANSPIASQVPRSVRPDPTSAPDVTVGFLLDERAAGDIPDTPIDPYLARMMPVRLGVSETRDAPPAGDCRVVSEPLDFSPQVGDVFGIDGPGFTAATVRGGEATSMPVLFNPTWGGNRFTIVLPNLHLRLTPTAGPFTFCT